MPNGKPVTWSQIKATIMAVVALGGIVFVAGAINAQVTQNQKDIAEQREAERRLRTRVTATEQNQAVVNSRTMRIESDVAKLTEQSEEIRDLLHQLVERGR